MPRTNHRRRKTLDACTVVLSIEVSMLYKISMKRAISSWQFALPCCQGPTSDRIKVNDTSCRADIILSDPQDAYDTPFFWRYMLGTCKRVSISSVKIL